RSNRHRDDAQHQADGAALLEHVAAEPPEAGDAVREVDFLGVLELLALDRRHHRGAHGDDVFVVETRLHACWLERAAAPYHRLAADLDVQIRRSTLDGD